MKKYLKWIGFCASVCLAVGVWGAVNEVEAQAAKVDTSVTYGDVDGSKTVNAGDALAVLEHAANVKKLSGKNLTAADVDLDDTVNATDALLILQRAAGVIGSLPVQNGGMTEAQARQKIVDVMISWIGLNEADGSHKKIIDIYNSDASWNLSYTDPWCAATVRAASVVADMTDIIPSGASCMGMIGTFQKWGAWVENDAYVPKPGDLIFFHYGCKDGDGDCTQKSTHVGMVEKVEDGVITVIEGNSSDKVQRVRYKIDHRSIRGFGLPDYLLKAK